MGHIVKTGQVKRVLVARVKPGSDLLLSLKEMADENGLKAGVILSCVGALSKARLRNLKAFPREFPITDKERAFLTFEGSPLEILALSGNITEAQGEPSVHAHAILSTMSGEEVSVVAGHLLEGTVVYSFAEVILAELSGVKMEKAMDPETKTNQLFRS